MKLHRLAAAALAAAVLLPACASAQDGPWFVRLGLHSVDPKSDNGTLAGTLDASIDSDFRPTLALGYHFTPNWAVEVLAATPFSHQVSLNGVEAVDFKHLPPTVSLQYYFAPDATVNPFLGAGINYTWTFDEETRGPLAGTDVGIENSWGLAAHAGLLFKAGARWDVIVDVRWMDIDADVTVDGANVGTANVDPLAYGVAVNWRF